MDIDLAVRLEPGESPEAILGIDDLRRDQVLDLGDGIMLRYLGTDHRRDGSLPDLLLLVLSFPIGVASSMVAARLDAFLESRSPRSIDEYLVKKKVVRRSETETVVTVYREKSQRGGRGHA